MTRLLLLSIVPPLLLTACESGDAGPQPGPDSESPTISREAFVSVYVDLRMAALRNPETEVTRAERERILEAHGVSSEELLQFVETRSREDPRGMQEIWAEIQDRIRQAREEAGTVDLSGGDNEAGDDGDDGDGGGDGDGG